MICCPPSLPDRQRFYSAGQMRVPDQAGLRRLQPKDKPQVCLNAEGGSRENPGKGTGNRWQTRAEYLNPSSQVGLLPSGRNLEA